MNSYGVVMNIDAKLETLLDQRVQTMLTSRAHTVESRVANALREIGNHVGLDGQAIGVAYREMRKPQWVVDTVTMSVRKPSFWQRVRGVAGMSVSQNLYEHMGKGGLVAWSTPGAMGNLSEAIATWDALKEMDGVAVRFSDELGESLYRMDAKMNNSIQVAGCGCGCHSDDPNCATKCGKAPANFPRQVGPEGVRDPLPPLPSQRK